MTVSRTARSPRGTITAIQERLDPWFDETGEAGGLLITFTDAGSTDGERIPTEVTAEARDQVEGRELMLFALNERSQVVYADPQFARFCQLTPERMLGRDISAFLHSYLVEYLIKESKSFVDFARENLASPVRVDFFRRPSNRRVTARCEFRVSEALEGIGWSVLVVARDEEERKHLSRLIELHQESSKQLLSGHFDMVITLNKARRITAINRICEERLGIVQQEMLDKHIRHLLHKTSDFTALGKALERVAGFQNVYNLRLDLRVADGSIPTLANVRGVRDSYNDEIGFILVLRDISEELKRRTILESLERMQALGQLAAGTAHQLSNYIVALSGYFAVLCEDLKMTPDRKDCIENIRSSISRLAALTKHLTSYARAQESPVISLCDANRVVRDALSLMEIRFVGKKVKLDVDMDEGLPKTYFSPLHLEQAVVNILANALDAVEQDKGEIRVATFHDEACVCISIADNGEGIPKNIKGRLFEAFVSTKEPGVGTGLGLSVAHSVVSSLKGSIDVESKEENGTVMTIRLPRPSELESST